MSVTNPVNGLAIVGGTATVGVTVNNTAGAGAANVNAVVTADPIGAVAVGPVAGGLAKPAPGAGEAQTADATGLAPGEQVVRFTATDATASNNPQTGDAVLTVLDHANASFGATDQNSLDLDVGTFVMFSGPHSAAFSIHNLFTTAGFTAGLDLDSIVPVSGDLGVLGTNLAPFDNLSPGDHMDFLASIDTSAEGIFQAVYELNLSDQDLPGAVGGQTLMLTLTGQVLVPEPATTALLAIGGLVLVTARIRRRRAL